MVGRTLDQLCNGLRVLLAILIGVLTIPVGKQVLGRYTGSIPVYLWTEELVTFIFVWAVMIGACLSVMGVYIPNIALWPSQLLMPDTFL